MNHTESSFWVVYIRFVLGFYREDRYCLELTNRWGYKWNLQELWLTCCRLMVDRASIRSLDYQDAYLRILHWQWLHLVCHSTLSNFSYFYRTSSFPSATTPSLNHWNCYKSPLCSFSSLKNHFIALYRIYYHVKFNFHCSYQYYSS